MAQGPERGGQFYMRPSGKREEPGEGCAIQCMPAELATHRVVGFIDDVDVAKVCKVPAGQPGADGGQDKPAHVWIGEAAAAAAKRLIADNAP